MAKTLDQRVVQLELDNKNFHKGVDTSLKDIEQLKKGLKFENVGKGLGDISNAIAKVDFGKMAAAIDNINSRFSVMGAAAFAVIQNITNSIINMGKNLANVIIFDPIKSGLSEYETQINAIQTILANTASKGTTMDDVTGALRELNTYADKTIYNFTEMTRNIGTFTAAGVDLETSVSAIKGIANLAAVSGSTSQQAATAMYQLSQALSSGTVKLMDWNSVVNAGMGGQVFQDNLKETARVHGIAIDDMIAEQGSFRETLSEGWLTSEILLESLSKFTGDLNEQQIISMGYTKEQAVEIMKLGEMANDAATKVKTLTQLQDTLKEAMQSGWTQSWELIIGDFDQAKELFTGISDLLGGVIGDSANARNNLLTLWQQLGGRDILVKAIYDAFDALFSIIGTVKEAAAEIFPPMTAGQLLIITGKIGELVSKFKMAVTNSSTLKKVFKALFSIIDIGIMFVKAFVKAFGGFLKAFSFVGVFINIGVQKLLDFIISLRNVIKETKIFDKFFGAVFKGLQQAINFVVGGIIILVAAISRLVKTHVNLKPIGDWFLNLKATLIDSGKLADWFGVALAAIVAWVDGLGPKLGDIQTTLKETFSKVGDWFKDAFSKIDMSFLKDIFKPGWFDSALDEIMNFGGKAATAGGVGLFLGILNAVRQFIKEGKDIFENVNEVLGELGDTLKAYQLSLKADALIKIAGAIAILAAAVLLMTFINPDNLGKATVALLGLMAGLITTMELFEKMSSNMAKLGSLTVAIIGIAFATLMLAGALKIISGIEPERMLAGTVAIAGLLGAIQAFLATSGGGTKLITLGMGMGILAASMVIMAGALLLFALIPFHVVAAGLLNMGLSLVTIGLAMQTMPKNLPITAFGVGLLAVSLLILAGVLQLFGIMKIEVIKQGMVTIAAMLLIIAGSLMLMKDSLAGAAAVRLVASALVVLAKALKRIGAMDPKHIIVALVTVAAALALIGGASAVLTPVIPSIQGLAIALLLFGAAMFLGGAGMAAFATGLLTLAAMTSAGMAAIALVITGIAALLPVVAYKVGEALVMLIRGVADNAPALLESIVELLRVAIEALVIVIPEIVDAVFRLITTLLETIAKRLPEVIEAGTDLIVSFLEGIEDSIPEIASAATDVVVTILETIATEYPKIVDAGFEMLINLIDGITNSVSTQIPRLITSVKRLGTAIITGIVSGLSGGESSVFNKIIELAKRAIAKFSEILGIKSPSTEFWDATKQIILGITGSLDHYSGNAYDAIEELGTKIKTKFAKVTEGMAGAIDDNIDLNPTITPVLDLTDVVSGSTEMNDMLASTDLKIGASLKAVDAIAANLRIPTTGSGDDAVPTDQQPIQYIQNNYSPKALSRYDIYRQTRNQLKGLTG